MEIRNPNIETRNKFYMTGSSPANDENAPPPPRDKGGGDEVIFQVIQNSNVLMTETQKPICFEFWSFEIVSDFVLRI